MKLRMIGSFVGYLMMASSLALASLGNGDRAGNGGDVILCHDSSGRETGTLLDYHEAKSRFADYFKSGRLVIDVSDENKLSIREYVTTILENIRSLDPERVRDAYEIYAKEMLDDIEALDRDPRLNGSLRITEFTEENLTDIDDSYETSIPQNCEKRQLVIFQGKPAFPKLITDGKVVHATYEWTTQFPEDSLYKIQIHLWNSLSNLQKALTIMHESIYRETLFFGANDSRSARYLNGIGLLKLDSLHEYLNRLRKTEIGFFKLLGSSYSIALDLRSFYKDLDGPYMGAGTLRYNATVLNFWGNHPIAWRARDWQVDLRGGFFAFGPEVHAAGLIFQVSSDMTNPENPTLIPYHAQYRVVMDLNGGLLRLAIGAVVEHQGGNSSYSNVVRLSDGSALTLQNTSSPCPNVLTPLPDGAAKIAVDGTMSCPLRNGIGGPVVDDYELSLIRKDNRGREVRTKLEEIILDGKQNIVSYKERQ